MPKASKAASGEELDTELFLTLALFSLILYSEDNLNIY